MRLPLALLLLTTAAQAQWQVQQSNTTADLRGVHSLGKGVAWASGSKGTVLRTTDEGKTWQTCTVPPGGEALDFRGIQAFDAKTAIVMSSGKGELSRLYKTSDGCRSWKLLFTNPDPEGFWDAVLGESDEGRLEILILGDPVGGKFSTFQSMYEAKQLKKFDAGGLTAQQGEGAFAASNSAEAINLDRLTLVFGTGGPLAARVFVACSSCQTDLWRTVTLPGFVHGTSAGVFSVHNHALDWVVVGGDYLKANDGAGNAAYSKDDAKTWHLAQTFPAGYRSAVAYSSSTKTWITVGPSGTDVSTNDGRNWHPLRPSPQGAPDEDQHWNALSLPFVVGPHGRIGLLRADAVKP